MTSFKKELLRYATSFKKELLRYAIHSDPDERLSKLYWETDVFKAVRSWLEQKRQPEIKLNFPSNNSTATNRFIDELLRELRE